MAQIDVILQHIFSAIRTALTGTVQTIRCHLLARYDRGVNRGTNHAILIFFFFGGG
jgi:hypothetical protein